MHRDRHPLGYVIEEWVHLSVHFAGWRGRYFRYIRRHQMYHHGARGRDLAFGLTSDAWDRMYGTQVRVPADRSTECVGAYDNRGRPEVCPVDGSA